MPDPDPPKPSPASFREEDPDALPAAHSRMDRGDYRPDPVLNPPPRFLGVAYRVPADRLFEAALEALRGAGVVVSNIERDISLISGTDPLKGGFEAKVTASVAETAKGGSRVLLTYDRPPGTPFDTRIDEKRLQQLLASVDAALAKAMEGGGPTASSP